MSIRFRGKGIPYGAGDRENGDRNHGFMNLKSDLALLLEVPELQTDVDLMQLMATINAPETGLFSVGCLSGSQTDGDRHWMTGYVEFAWNSISQSREVQNYFPVFFCFGRLLNDCQFAEPIRFHWQMEPAHFFESNSDGWTCSITITTRGFATIDEAKQCWAEGIHLLAEYLSSIQIEGTDSIYASGAT
ncbi:MAG: hypothetical protein ACRERV_17150 [Methylococcales bacterium]